MAIPGAGWTIIWSPDGTWANLMSPDGQVMGQWFEGIPEASTFDPETTQAIIDQASGDEGIPEEPTGEGWSTQDILAGLGVPQEIIDFFLGLGDYTEWSLQTSQDYTQFMIDYQEQQDAEAEARRQAEIEEQRAYSEAMALARQHMTQEQNWGYAAANAPGAGAGILANLLPAYLPESVAGSLYGYGKRMGTEYDPAWPGGTALNEAQMTPTGMDWIEYLKQQGYPGYLWER